MRAVADMYYRSHGKDSSHDLMVGQQGDPLQYSTLDMLMSPLRNPSALGKFVMFISTPGLPCILQYGSDILSAASFRTIYVFCLCFEVVRDSGKGWKCSFTH